MKLETERLMLRPFEMTDAPAMFANWASDPDVLQYMPYEVCNTLEETQETIESWLQFFDSLKGRSGAFAIVLKSSGEVIGTVDYAELDPASQAAEIGYQLGKVWWGNGYAAEALTAVISYCFETAGLNRLWGAYDPRNPSAGKVMEKAGMIYEGTMRQYKVRRGQRVDRILYAILKDDYDTVKEIAYYNNLPVTFDGFVNVPALSDGEIFLVCTKKSPASPEKKWVPAYNFFVCKNGEKIGEINLRIGYTDGLYYGGQIGYGIDEAYRGHGYAAAACRLLVPVARAHNMKTLIITNNVANTASKRVCEKLGAKLVRVARLPEWHDLYKEGQRFSNIFEWEI